MATQQYKAWSVVVASTLAFTAVSYTHLDVYKRQVHYKSL